jgi:hypothetical protein
MPPFRRVEDRRASSTALGILVPPGERTLVILRPRALAWDLLPVRPESATFYDFSRDEAAGVARRAQRALEQGAGSGASPVRIVTRADGGGYHIEVRTADLNWIVCLRVPGQPYQATLFATLETASDAAARLAAVLWPDADASQEYYFNTQNFQSARLPTPES